MDPLFTAFELPLEVKDVPNRLILMHDHVPHPLSWRAATELQHYLGHQQDWKHNFGLPGNADGAVIGKMFGVLVVRTVEGELGYLAAFSGKLAGGNHHARFVPPVYDMLTENSFLNIGMQNLAGINREIEMWSEMEASAAVLEKISRLKRWRKEQSLELQQELFANYYFMNAVGKSRNISDIFRDAGYKNPPSGAGECAGPKLLQYAFLHHMQPLALAEFWWGQSPKSNQWRHREFYPCCREKCGPILAHMLSAGK